MKRGLSSVYVCCSCCTAALTTLFSVVTASNVNPSRNCKQHESMSWPLPSTPIHQETANIMQRTQHKQTSSCVHKHMQHQHCKDVSISRHRYVYISRHHHAIMQQIQCHCCCYQSADRAQASCALKNRPDKSWAMP